MTRTIFFTGATGFLGQRVLPALIAQGWHLRVLVRDADRAKDLPGEVEICVGDLTDPSSYHGALDGVETVLHLGALTGKASKQEHERINRQATKQLITSCAEQGVRQFLFVSSIAAGYADKSFYPYAEAKARAEQDLVASGLHYTILRPTLILGRGSPISDALDTLAGLPVVPLPQKGGPVSVQPVSVEDVTRGIVEVLKRNAFDREILDFGGPDVVSMKELLRTIAQLHFGREPRVMKLPLRLVQWPLAMLEPLARAVMPATAGQFAVFGNDSTIAENWLVTALQPQMTRLRDQIGSASQNDDMGDDGNAVPHGPETSPADAQTEARTLCRHMTGKEPGDAAVRHYANALNELDMGCEGGRFDQLTLSLARRGGIGLWLADGFCGLLHRHGTLRRRQVLCAAILENEAGTYQSFDGSPDIGAVRAFLRLAWVGIVSVTALLAGAVFLLPLRFWLGRTRPTSSGSSQ